MYKNRQWYDDCLCSCHLTFNSYQLRVSLCGPVCFGTWIFVDQDGLPPRMLGLKVYEPCPALLHNFLKSFISQDANKGMV